MDNFHGWLMTYDASTLKQVNFMCTTPDGYGASIWQAGRAPAIDENGNIYVVTGNGDYDGSVNFGETILKFSGADLSLLDYYTPPAYSFMTANDLDFGSTGAILVAGTKQVLTVGKTGQLFLVNRNSMGHLDKTSGSAVSIQANQGGTFDMALWNNPSGPIAYVHELGSSLQAYQIVNGKLNPTMLSQTTPTAPTLFSGIAISGSSNDPGNAIVWQTTANYGIIGHPGTLHAFDANDLSRELWNSDMVPGDGMGRFAKFVAPTVANGKVYVPTFSNELVIYGPRSGPATPADAGVPQITTVANGATFFAGPVSPGEMVAIFGANLGPAVPAGPQVDDTGHLTKSLAHTKVFFGGVPASLLYSSSNQVNAVVPFGLSGDTTEVQVQNASQFSTPVSVPVLSATPALFSADGSGGEIGAILNQDGKLNSFGDAAPKGSIITLYATGAGQTNPAGDDGLITSTGPFPTPILPVTLLIDGHNAEILYAGAAPQMTQGVIQINARVPSAASSGQVQLVLKMGTFSSPNTVSMIVQ
jgi:uncharacterized protein (TIGR03437 family)